MTTKWQRRGNLFIAVAAIAVMLADGGWLAMQQLGVTLNAQAPSATPAAPVTTDQGPVVTDLMQTQFVLAAQSKELWQLKAYQAQTEYLKAVDQLDKLIAAWQKPGYDLKLNDQQKLEYAKKTATASTVKNPPK